MTENKKVKEKKELSDEELKKVDGGCIQTPDYYCPHCKKSISFNNWICPYCGQRVK